MGLAGRIGKQVRNLRGTAAVMAEPEPKGMSLHDGVGRHGKGEDARAGRPALKFILPGMAVQTAVIPGAGPVLRTDQTFARKTKVHRVLMIALFWYGSVRLLQPVQALSFCGAIGNGLYNKEVFVKKIQLCRAAAMLSALTMTLCACGATASSASSVSVATMATTETAGPYPVTITNYNYAGDEVAYTYQEAPERVVAVYQGSIETMIALGLEDHVIASYGLDNEVKAEWQEGFAAMHYQEAVFAPDKETVTMLQPDMILSWGSLFSDKMLGDVAGWNDKGVATYMNSNTRPGGHGRTLENEYTDILNLGRIFDVEETAEALVSEMKQEIAQTLNAVEGQAPVRVAVVEPQGDTISNYGAKTLAGDMVTQLGGELVNPDGNEMSKEDLLACNPDVIFVVYMAYSGEDPASVMDSQKAVIAEDPALASLSAVQNGRVCLVMLGDIYAAGPRSMDGIRTLAAGMYPELAA